MTPTEGQTTTPSGAPDVDVLAWINKQILCLSGGHPNSIHGINKRRAEQARTAVAAMIAREAALVAERDALKFRSTNRCVTLQDSRPLDERLQVYARQFGNETIFSRTGKTTDRSSEIE